MKETFNESSQGNEFERGATVKQWTAYNMKTRKACAIVDPAVVTLKNGRKAIRGVASDDLVTTVVRILGPEALAEWESGLR